VPPTGLITKILQTAGRAFQQYGNESISIVQVVLVPWYIPSLKNHCI